MPRLPLACSVRACGLPLERRERTWRCARGHSYDVARSGYVNLLQPQDRRSDRPGDSRASLEARVRLLEAGVGRATLDAAVRRVATVGLRPDAVVADLGSGSGDALATLAQQISITGVGIDLSIAAADQAARRFPALTWVVANADRRLPLLDGSVDLILSLYGRRSPAEWARVLAPSGFVMVAVPGEDDLIELRANVQGSAVRRTRDESVVAALAPFFDVSDRSSVREHHRLEAERLRDLLRGTYRGARRSAAAKVQALGSLDVTLASELLLFSRRQPARR